MQKYQVTEQAGRDVAGVRGVKAGDVIELTSEAAEHPLRLGQIVAASQAPKPAEKVQDKAAQK